MSETAEQILLAVVAEDRVTAVLYKAGDDGFFLETIVWPAVWGMRSHFSRDMTPGEARAWMIGHGVEIESEGPDENDL